MDTSDVLIDLLLNPEGFDIESDIENLKENYDDEEIREMLEVVGDNKQVIAALHSPDFEQLVLERLEQYRDAFSDLTDNTEEVSDTMYETIKEAIQDIFETIGFSNEEELKDALNSEAEIDGHLQKALEAIPEEEYEEILADALKNYS